MTTPVSQKKQVKNILERTEALENDLAGIAQAVQAALEEANNRTARLAKVIEAVVELLGAPTVDATMKEIEANKLQAASDAAKAELEKGVSEGRLTRAVGAGELSLIVGREFDAEGNTNGPGRVQVTFSSIKPEYQEVLRGQGSGFSFPTEAGGKFEVLEVYDVVPDAPVAPEPVAETTSA